MARIRKICFFTGKRGGFTHLIPIIERLKREKGISCSAISTDMHLTDLFGKTVLQVDAHVDKNYKLHTMLASDSKVARAKSIGIGIMGCSELLDQIKPDLVFVLGDRGEVLAMTIAAMELNIPIAHLFGGDITQGGVDEPVRHAITKMANIHFASNQDSYKRIIKMGEEPWRVHNVGSPVLDLIRQGRFSAPETIYKKFSLDSQKPVLLLLQHSVTWQVEQARRQIRQTLQAIQHFGLPTVAVYPCSDPGYEQIIHELQEFNRFPYFQLHKNIEFSDFWGLMNIAGVLIGNSSAGALETASFKLPCINIGIRQEGRLRANNVIDAGHDSEEIIKAIDKALFNGSFKRKVGNCRSPYGDGLASERIVSVLKNLELDQMLIRKKIPY